MNFRLNTFGFKLISTILILHIQTIAFPQSRLYVSGGLTGSTGGPLNLLKDYTELLGYPYLDLEWDTKLVGSFHFVSGMSFYGLGYLSDDRFWGSSIEFRAKYLSVPLMVRWNFRNRNYLFLDLGLHPYYLVHAKLKESIRQFESLKTVEGNITPYSSRLYMGLKFQGSIAIRRILLSSYILLPFEGQTVTKNLDEHWGLNKQQSTYLLNSDHLPIIFGVKGGYRLK